MNLYKYQYSHSKSYKKDPENHAKKMNFRGEVYEASFYETMVANIESESENSIKIISKGPYAQKDNKYLSTGFFCDSFGRCIYNSDRISIAEFDCIKIDKYSLFFYECTLTQRAENLRALKKEARRKSKLLKKLFPNKDICCVVVSDNDLTLSFFKNESGCSIYKYAAENLDLIDLANNSRPEALAPALNMKSANSLNRISNDFTYLEEFKKISSVLFQHGSLSSVESDIISSDGLFERLYWGKVRTKDIKSLDIKKDSDFIIISINFKNIKNPKIRYYYIDSKDGAIYEALNKPKKLNRMKSSRSEIIKISKSLPVRSVSELQNLESEIIDWRNKALQRTSR
ncbi:hypothetical protein ACU6TU_06780 [Halomonas sp. LS-001]